MSVEQTPVGDLGKAADFLENVSNGKQAVSEAEADAEFARGAQIIKDLIDPPNKLQLNDEATDALKDVSEGVLKAEYEARIAALEAQLAEALAPKVKPKIGVTPADRNMIREMRGADPADKKTCAACKTRKPIQQMGNGLAEVCDSCKE